MTASVIDEISDKLYLKWSPEQISGWLLIEQNIDISHESIYRHVWADKAANGELYKNLRRHARKYKVRGSNGKTQSGQIKNRICIDERPESVDHKIAVCDWEIDTVIGKNHSGALIAIALLTSAPLLGARLKRKYQWFDQAILYQRE